MDEITIYQAMKAATWERAKGELRALVGIIGSQSSVRGRPDLDGEFPYQKLERVVDAFVHAVESDGLAE